MRNEQRKMINFKLISSIIFILICSSLAIADQKVISTENDFRGGSFSSMQLNRNPSNTCDASRYTSAGYDCPLKTCCNECDFVADRQDPLNDCSAVICTDYIYGWSGDDCKKYLGSSANNGNCNGAGACYTSVADSCLGVGTTSAACGSSECKITSTCIANSYYTNYDNINEVCYTSDQHDCSSGWACNDIGYCEGIRPCDLPWGGTIAHGQSKTAYKASSVRCTTTCISETRTCNDGILSGSFTYESCSVSACRSCYGYSSVHAPSSYCTVQQWAYLDEKRTISHGSSGYRDAGFCSMGGTSGREVRKAGSRSTCNDGYW